METIRAWTTMLACAACLLAGARAGTAGEIQLTRCWGSGDMDYITQLDAWFDNHGNGGANDLTANGWYVDDGERFSCEVVLPEDYDDTSATAPSVLLYGYNITEDRICLNSPSCFVAKVTFEIEARCYGHGDSVNKAVSAGGSQTRNVGTETCPAPNDSDECYESHEFMSFEADAMAEADSADCAAGKIMVLTVRRDDDTVSFPENFFVLGLRLEYPTS